MNSQHGVHGDCFKHVSHQGACEVTANEVVFKTVWLPLVYQIGPARNVHNGSRQSLIEGNKGVTEARNTGLIAECFAKCLTKDNGGVFNGVVNVNVCVTGCLHGEVDQRVLGQCCQHVVEKRHRRGNVVGAIAIEVER